MLDIKKKIIEKYKNTFLKNKNRAIGLGEYFELKAYLKQVEEEIDSLLFENNLSQV